MDSPLSLSRLQGLSPTGFSKTSVAVGLFLAYLLLVRSLRYRALHRMEKKFAHLLKDPYSMTYKEAHEINALSAFYDNVYWTRMAGPYALIKSYVIERGTHLLMKTKQLSTTERVGKRLEDTGLSFMEVLAGDMDGERSMRSLAKVNWLHARYKNQITNDEFLHTLYITGLEAVRFIDAYDWRKLTELERVAVFMVWREIGLRMCIRDIPPTFEAFTEWVENYRQVEGRPSENAKILTNNVLHLATQSAPKWQHGFIKNMMAVFLEPETRRAVSWDDPPRWVEIVVLSGYRIRAFLIRHFFLPRLNPISPIGKRDPSNGRLYKDSADFEPWYIKDTFWNRWSIWLASMGKYAPAPKYKSNGYLPEELGPIELEKASKEPVLRQAEALRTYVKAGGEKVGGCPFAYGDVGNWLEELRQ